MHSTNVKKTNIYKSFIYSPTDALVNYLK